MLRLATSLFMVVLLASCVSNPMEPKGPSELQSAGEPRVGPSDEWQILHARQKAREERDAILHSEYYSALIAMRNAASKAGAFEAELAKEIPAHQEIILPDFSAIPSDGPCVACEIRFDVTPAGVPVNILAMCTAPEYNPIAHDAIAQARFAARIKRGIAVRRLNVIYPIETGICE